MKKGIFTAMIISFCSCFFLPAAAQRETHTFNLGMESIDKKTSLPAHWIRWGMKNWTLAVDSTVKHSGKYSLLMYPQSNAEPGSFVCCALPIPAVYKGKRITLSGWMKLENVHDGKAGFLLRIDGQGQSQEFDNMHERNIHGTADWKKYSITLNYPEGAEMIYIGALLNGKGKMWVDDFSVTINGKDLADAEKKVPEYKADLDTAFRKGSGIASIDLSPQTIDNLDVLGKVWGFLKYHHPAIAAGEYNWDNELFRILPSVLDAGTPAQRNDVLLKWIEKLGPVKGSVTLEKDTSRLAADLDWITDEASLGKELSQKLIQTRNAKRSSKSYYISTVTFVGNPVFTNEKGYAWMPYPDAGYRLLALYRYWNCIQYFFPSKYLIGEDWKKVLTRYIPKVINAKSELEYKLTMLELIADIHDTHAIVFYDSTIYAYQGRNYAPLMVRFVEGKAVVYRYADSALVAAAGLKKGDVITRVNGESVEDIIKRLAPITAASNYPVMLREIAFDLLRTNNEKLKVEYERDGNINTAEVTCRRSYGGALSLYSRDDTCWKILPGNIGYIFPGTISNTYLKKIKRAAKGTNGLIIDLRCYPNDFITYTLGKYLTAGSRPFVRFTYGSVKDPGNFTFTGKRHVGGPFGRHYHKKVIVIVNEITQSNAEFTAMSFRASKLVTVIGSTTAGADGNVSSIVLPGGIATRISGLGVYYPDKRDTQRTGIVPDIEVKPTVQGIKDGHDEVLEKAIELINAK